jgi:zinc D-Ala-D-Ala dipeptidase
MLRAAPLLRILASSLLFVTGSACGSRQASDLVELNRVIPGICLQIRYATTDNFTHHKVYDSARCFLRRGTAIKLKGVEDELHAQGLGLKVWDGYRPLSVQKIFWALVPDERYVANPATGSRHNRGAALDLTLVHLANCEELKMPTPHDNLSVRAHRDYMNLPPEAIANRKMLEDVMTRHGFIGLPTEWWHFDDTDWQRYRVLDIPVGSIGK